jgi:type IV pilus assembly protein PilE
MPLVSRIQPLVGGLCRPAAASLTSLSGTGGVVRKAKGFSLVELLVTVTIIGILAAVAIPSYDKYMQRSRRSEAQQLLAAIASREAAYLLDSRLYTNIIGTTGLNVALERWTCTPTAAPTTCANTFYSVSIVPDNTATPPTFVATATAQGTQVSDGNLTIDQSGAKVRRVGSGPNLGW